MGRVNKKTKVILIGAAALGLMVATVPLAIWVTHSQTAQLSNARDRCAVGQHSAYRVVFQDNKIMPDHLTARLCDRLTFINEDPKERLLAFGPHAHHISYDGVSERLLNRNQSLTVTLVKTGTYGFHDHIDDSLRGTFTVTKP